MLGFPIGEHPDIGRDAGVVEHVQRQGDDGLQPVILDDPAPDVAFALACIAGEERRTVMHLGDTAAQLGLVFHLREHVRKEQQLAIARTCDERVLGITCMLDDEARVLDAVLTTHAFKIALPALAVWRIGEHEVELARGEGIVGERGVLGPPTMLSAASPSPFSSRSALAMA